VVMAGTYYTVNFQDLDIGDSNLDLNNFRKLGKYRVYSSGTGTVLNIPSSWVEMPFLLEVYVNVQVIHSRSIYIRFFEPSTNSWGNWERPNLDINDITGDFVRYDTSQSLTQQQKDTVKRNIGAYESFIRYDTSQSLTQQQKDTVKRNIGAYESFIRYDASQSLTDIQKSVARENIGFRRVNLTNATSDYYLKVYEEAIINFNSFTIPLRIQTHNGTYYEMDIIPSNVTGQSGGSIWIGGWIIEGVIFLLPNNVTYSNMFVGVTLYRTRSFFDHGIGTYHSFLVGNGFSAIKAFIINRTNYKNVRGIIDIYGVTNSNPTIGLYSIDWINSTIQWTSLGTIQYINQTETPQGTILVRRLL